MLRGDMKEAWDCFGPDNINKVDFPPASQSTKHVTEAETRLGLRLTPSRWRGAGRAERRAWCGQSKGQSNHHKLD